MNKIIAPLFLIFALASFSYPQHLAGIEISDEEIMSEINKMSARLDGIKNKKEKAALYEETGEFMFSKKAYDASAEIYNMLLNMKLSKRKKADCYIRLGDISAAKNNYSDSLEYYKSALSLYKKDNNIKRRIGDILLESNLYNLAEQIFKEIVASDKNSDYAKRKLGDIYYSQNRFSDALDYYKAIAHSGYDKDLIINMAACYRSLNKIEKAEELVNGFLSSFPDSEIYFLSGMLYSDTAKFDEAERRFLDAIKTDDANFSAYIRLAAIYLEKNELDKAEEMLRKAKTLNSYSAAADILFAEAEYKRGRLYEARRYASGAVLKAKTPFVKRQAERMSNFLNKSGTRQ